MNRQSRSTTRGGSGSGRGLHRFLAQSTRRVLPEVDAYPETRSHVPSPALPSVDPPMDHSGAYDALASYLADTDAFDAACDAETLGAPVPIPREVFSRSEARHRSTDLASTPPIASQVGLTSSTYFYSFGCPDTHCISCATHTSTTCVFATTGNTPTFS